VFLANVINLILEDSPNLFVLNALDFMNSSFRHRGREASDQLVPLIGSLGDRLRNAKVTTCKELNDALPEIRQVIVFRLVNQFAHLKSYFVVLESSKTNVLRFVAINSQIYEVTRSRVLIPHQCNQILFERFIYLEIKYDKV
jgi:hypothetical protein